MKFRILLLSAISSLVSPVLAKDRIVGDLNATRSVVRAQNAMVCSSHPLATQIGLNVIRQGGSAVDAAIAVNAALGLMEPTGCGIGGDLFAIVWDPKTKKLHGLNASGPSPQSLTIEHFLEKELKEIPLHGALPVSVPGTVGGWALAHEKFGKLPLADLLKEPIAYAEKGFPMTDLIAHYLKKDIDLFNEKKFANVNETYVTPNGGELPKGGELYKNPFLAQTYQAIADKGRDGFYQGRVAEAMVKVVKDQGGFLSANDLTNYTPEWVDPVSVNYRGYDIWELPPNGQGITALQMLQILEGYDFSKIPFGSTEHLHLYTEAKKLAFEDRAKYYADMKFANVPVAKLISDDYAAQRRKLIGETANEYTAGTISQGDTVMITTADPDGMMVSFIQSNYRHMGSGMIPAETGFVLQNRGKMFTLTKGQNNTYEPGKRPFHTIIPAFITKDGAPYACFGVMGGDFQPQGHTQIVMNHIDFGMNMQEAGDAPRFDHTGSSTPMGKAAIKTGEVRVESGISYETVRGLLHKNHKVGFVLGKYGGYQAIRWDDKNKSYIGASDSRKDGQAAGF